MREIRYGLRALSRARAFTIGVVATLGVGLGGAATVAGLAESVLRPLPFPEPDRLVAVWESVDGKQRVVAPANYLDWRRDSRTFSGLAAHLVRSASITVQGSAFRGRVGVVSGNFFEVLGVRPRFGPGFDPELNPRFPGRQAVLSDTAWRTSFDADPGVVGTTFLVEDEAYEIVGIAPAGLALPEPDITAWLRSRTEAPELRFLEADLTVMRDAWYFEVLGRLAPGATLATAREEMTGLAARLEATYPESNEGHSVLLRPLLEQTVADFRPTLITLGLSVLLLLVAASVNVLHLVLARHESRGRDMTVRMALGASQATLRRLAWTEGALLGGIGGAAGLGVAAMTLRLGVENLGSTLPRQAEIALRTGPAVAVVIGAAALGAGIAWLAHSIHGPNRQPASTLRSRTGFGGAGSSGLVAAQVAAAVALLATSALLGRSMQRLGAVDLGFAEENTVTVRVALPDAWQGSYEERIGRFEEVRQRFAALPEVNIASFGSQTPLSMGPRAGLRMTGGDPNREPPNVGWIPVHYDYFEAFGIELAAGRFFDSNDRAGSGDVAVANEALVRAAFPNDDPIGRQVTIGLDGHDRPLTIVGVIKDTRTLGPIQAAGPVLYRPMDQTTGHSAEAAVFVAEVTGAGPQHVALLAATLRDFRPELPVYAGALGRDLAASFTQASTALLGVVIVLASSALLLAVVGVYGVASQTARRRRREIGVRMALGAHRRSVVGMIVRQGLWRAAPGIPIGLALTVFSSRFLRGYLFDVEATDPVTMAGVAIAVFGLAAAALLLPAHRAAGVDPATATRAE